MRFVIFCLFYQLFFTSCVQKRYKEEVKLDFKNFVESSNEVLKSNSYFGILSLRSKIPVKDTALLVAQPNITESNFARLIFEIDFEGKKTELNIEFYGDLSNKEIKFLEEEFMIERKLEGVSCMVKLNTFFCKVWLDADLPLIKSYLQNIKICLLENYIQKISVSTGSEM